ncbi:MAG TPA: hypothetical protein VE710_14930 [Candidatus Bathyarchaeia archaeon]|nr:hypothetical protein [Candidatus Bathyarchaeia archaeon]
MTTMSLYKGCYLIVHVEHSGRLCSDRTYIYHPVTDVVLPYISIMSPL